jgi:hypothetical protein
MATNISETPAIPQVKQLLAENGYEVAELENGLLRARDLDTGVSLQVALEGNVLYVSVTLTSVAAAAITPDVMRRMLAAGNGISTSAFKLIERDGKVVITLSSFCTLQNMGPEDQDDVLSLAGYLMADMLEARNLLEPVLLSSALS